ncbi:hypothetical protein NUW58_g1374 [Xylaria curta]|uniref:Uncharacterized protein n=1 Tax=Xylaria curta TaxID=42375 RepID=A0ACC1PL20_9PEZI|nr:hypothetical protein NUW58_g1374 [Xylaria curta]
MAGPVFTDFKWNDRPLCAEDEIPSALEDCHDAEALTAYVLKLLMASKHNYVHIVLEEHKNIVRLIDIKKITRHGGTRDADWNFHIAARATAFAYYLFFDKTEIEACQQCNSQHSKGPCVECVSSTSDIMSGACTNCYYSGNGRNCSIRKRLEREKAEEERLALPKFNGFSQEDLKEATDEQLVKWLRMIDAAISQRVGESMLSKKRRRL